MRVTTRTPGHVSRTVRLAHDPDGLSFPRGRVERPVRFVEDRAALDAIIAMHAEERNHFPVRPGSCRVALYGQHKYVQLVSVVGSSRATCELRTDGVRRVSSNNLPLIVVAAFRDGVACAQSRRLDVAQGAAVSTDHLGASWPNQ